MRPWLRYLPLLCYLVSLTCLLAGLPGWLARPQTELICILDASDSLLFAPPAELPRYEAFLQPERTVRFAAAGTTRLLFDRDALAASKTAPTNAAAQPPDIAQSIQPSRTNLEQALATAAALPTEGYTRRRVLFFTDGRENAGHAAEAARRYASSLRVDVVPIGVVPVPDARVEWLSLPGTAIAGQTLTATAIVSSATPTDALVELLAPDEQTVLQRKVLPLNPVGTQTDFSFSAPTAGLQQYAVRVELAGDKIPQNDLARAAVLVRGGGVALWIGFNPPPAGWLPDGLHLCQMKPDQLTFGALYPESLTASVDTGTPPTTENGKSQSAPVALLVLDNLSAADLSGRERLLEEYLQRGGRLLVIGGDRSLAAGGWAGGALEKLLPAEVIPADRLEVVFALDVSGSMGEDAGSRSKLALAQGAVLAATGGLGSSDEAGLVAFSRTGKTLLPLGKITGSDWGAALRETGAGGGTSIFAGIQSARTLFPKDDTGIRRHILVITDGDTLEKDELRNQQLAQTRQDLQRDKIGLSVIAVGSQTDTVLLNDLTAGLGSVTLAGERLAELPQILQHNLDTARDGYFRSHLTVHSGGTDWTAQRTEAFGPLRGRPGDQFLLRAQNGEGLATSGRLGLGQVLLLGGSPWHDWAGPSQAQVFFRTSIQDLLTGDSGKGHLRTWCSDNQVRIRWQPQELAGGAYAAELLDWSGNAAGFALLQPERGGSWSAALAAPADGPYSVNLWTGRFAAAENTGTLLERCALRVENREEYLRYGADGTALENMALAGGGALVFAPEQLADWDAVPATGEGGRFPLPLALAALAFLAAGLLLRGWCN